MEKHPLMLILENSKPVTHPVFGECMELNMDDLPVKNAELPKDVLDKIVADLYQRISDSITPEMMAEFGGKCNKVSKRTRIVKNRKRNG